MRTQQQANALDFSSFTAQEPLLWMRASSRASSTGAFQRGAPFPPRGFRSSKRSAPRPQQQKCPGALVVRDVAIAAPSSASGLGFDGSLGPEPAEPPLAEQRPREGAAARSPLLSGLQFSPELVAISTGARSPGRPFGDAPGSKQRAHAILEQQQQLLLLLLLLLQCNGAQRPAISGEGRSREPCSRAPASAQALSPRHCCSLRHELETRAVYLVQGVLELATLAQRLLLKDELNADPAHVALFLSLTSIPWCLKPLVGWASDTVPLFGFRRKSYLLLASLAGARLGLAGGAQVQAGRAGQGEGRERRGRRRRSRSARRRRDPAGQPGVCGCACRDPHQTAAPEPRAIGWIQTHRGSTERASQRSLLRVAVARARACV